MNYRLKLAVSCLLAVSAITSAYGANLLEVYKLAQQSDPQIREADATRLAAKEAKPQAWADLFPAITGSASMSRVETDSTGRPPQALGNIGGTGTTVFTDGTSKSITESKGWSLALTQTVFRWDRFAAIGRANAQVALAETTYRAAEQDLIVRVMKRYFDVLYAKDIVDTNDAALSAFTRQLEQAEKRFEVGLIAITDVQESRAQRDRAAANLIEAKRTLATNQELLRELTGEDIAVLAAPGDEMPLIAPSPAEVAPWVSTAMEQNLTLIAAKLNADIAESNVSVSRAGHLPAITLSARHGDGSDDQKTTTGTTIGPRDLAYSPGSVEDRISLDLTIPIFSGGGDQSRIRQAKQNRRAADERVQRTTRETERTVRDNYLGVLSNISKVQALKQAMESSKTSLQATQAGFEVGTRTTVDVLEAQRQLYLAQGEYYKSRYDYLQTRVLLEQAAGSLNAEDLERINSYLQK